MNFFNLNFLFFFILYSQKYPDFINYVDQELQEMKCCVCAVDLEKNRIVISNPCSHFLCPDCAAELIRNWELDGRKKKCPMCRTILQEDYFNKPFACNMTKIDSTAVFLWIPKGVYLKSNYEQDLLQHLTNNDLHMAFASAFMLDRLPNPLDQSFSKEWEEYYCKRMTDMYCSCCKIKIEIDLLFMAKCGHFFCTICSSFMQSKEREDSTLKCTECFQNIESDELPLIFMRPV